MPRPVVTCNRNAPLRRAAIGALCAAGALLASLGVRAAPAAKFAPPLPALCAALQSDGWQAPASIRQRGQRDPAEMRIPGQLYLCRLERDLRSAGPGHAPQLGALLSDVDGASIIFSANVYCAADSRAALDALAQAVERGLAAIALKPPAGLLDAVRAQRAVRLHQDAITFDVAPIKVDADACARVRDGELGAVLYTLDVAVEPASAKQP